MEMVSSCIPLKSNQEVFPQRNPVSLSHTGCLFGSFGSLGELVLPYRMQISQVAGNGFGPSAVSLGPKSNRDPEPENARSRPFERLTMVKILYLRIPYFRFWTYCKMTESNLRSIGVGVKIVGGGGEIWSS